MSTDPTARGSHGPDPLSLAHQTVPQLGGTGSVLVRQRTDHARLDALLHELEATPVAEQDAVLRRLNRLVFRHAFAEETVLWPVLRRALDDGDALTERVEREHQEVNDLVVALETTAHDDPERPARLARLVEVLREDVRDEEDVLLPRLQQTVPVAELHRLGRRWDVVRAISPTRPHPTVSRRPPGNALSALPLTLLDNARDGLDAVARRAPSRVGGAAQALSTGLAAAAGVVERTPLARRGDRATAR